MRKAALGLGAFFALAASAGAQQYNPGYVPMFRPGFQFHSSGVTYDYTQGSLPSGNTPNGGVNGTAVGAGGVLAGSNAPRFDYANTSPVSALLVEPMRVNSLRNNTMVGAAAGSPGTLPTNWTSQLAGLTQTVVGTGTSNGINYIDIRLNGTTNTTNARLLLEGATAIPAANGQSWAQSVYLAVVGGSTANLNGFYIISQESTSGGVLVRQDFGASILPSLTSTLTRFSYSTTLSGGATVAAIGPLIGPNFASGVAVDITLRIGLPQMELGASPSTPILTSGTQVIRSADAISFTAPSGVSTITYTFDDNSTQSASISPGAFTIPTTLNRPRIKTIRLQ